MQMRWMTISGLLGLLTSLLLLQACGPSGPLSFLQPSINSQDDCGYVQNVYGQRISWKGQTPIRLYVHESFPASFKGALESAIGKWEQADGKPLFQIVAYNIPGPLTPRQDGSNVLYYMNTWEDSKSSEQARTSVYSVGDRIQEADIRINAKNFTFYWQSPGSSSDVHIESLLVHELGHILGLKHKDSAGSVMGTYLSSLTVRSSISSTDLGALKCEY